MAVRVEVLQSGKRRDLHVFMSDQHEWSAYVPAQRVYIFAMLGKHGMTNFPGSDQVSDSFIKTRILVFLWRV